MEMTHERWLYTAEYAATVFGDEDEVLTGLRRLAADAGLPDIAVSPDIGRLLKLLASTTRGRLAVEVGTLGGYSGIWIARGLAADGRLITIEGEPRHAVFARGRFDAAGVGGRVEIREGWALDVLPGLVDELGPASVDLAFIDAAKEEYPEYFRLLRQTIAPGGFLIADNVFGTGGSWIDQMDHPGVRATDEFNRTVAADPGFLTTAVASRSGVLIARRLET